MKRTLVAIALSMLLGSAQAQEATSGTPTTVNLIDPNNYTGQSLSGSWGGANIRDHVFGCCTGGPGAAVDTYNGTIWFSWGASLVSQTIAINQALKDQGLSVSGFNYSYEFYNYGYNRGTLGAFVTLTDNTGKTLQNYQWWHPGDVYDGWQTNYGTKTFTSPYSVNTLGNITLGFTGQDDRFWAGYYGPAVTNASLSLNYGVDPCVSDPLSSPTCSGFSAALAKLAPTPAATEPVIAAVAVEPVITTSPAVAEIAPSATAISPTVATSPVATATVSASPVASAVPAASSASRSTTSNTTAVAAAMRAVAETQATVAMVLSQAQESAAASQAQDNTGSQDTSSQTASTGSALGTGLTITFGFQVPGAFVLPGTQLNLGRSTVDTSAVQQTVASTPEMPSLAAAQTVTTDTVASETSPTSTRALAAMSNTQMTAAEETAAAPGTSSVRNVAPPSELAGGPDIGQLAAGPQGFSAYLTAQLRDAAFYAPREVYRGQVNVDNARALRGLGSDSKHQEMVNQQYRK